MDFLDEELFDLARQQLTLRVLCADFLELFVILEEKAEPLIRNINSEIRSQLPVLLNSLLPARQGILVNLVLNHFGRVRQNDGALISTRRHLILHACDGREKRRVDRSGLEIVQLLGDVTSHTEVGVLVDGGRDQARYLVVVAEDVRERVREGGDGLDGWVGELAHALVIGETEDAANLTQSDVLLRLEDVGIHLVDVLRVTKDKGLLWIEAKSNDILDIVVPHLEGVLPRELLIVKVLLVVRDLNH